MDWIAALALALPLAAALALAARWAGDALVVYGRIVARAQREATWVHRTASKRSAQAALAAARIAAKAVVRAARYRSGAIKVRPRAEEPPEPTPFERWLHERGRHYDERVQNKVEWAFGRIEGTESDEQGTVEDAWAIIEELALDYAPDRPRPQRQPPAATSG